MVAALALSPAFFSLPLPPLTPLPSSDGLPAAPQGSTPGPGWGSLPLGLLGGGADALGAALGHGRGADGRQQDPHSPAGQRRELRGGADKDSDVLHGGDGPQVDHEQDPLQILIQSQLPWCAGRRGDRNPLLQSVP